MVDKKKGSLIFCSFCGKNQKDVEKLVVGTEAFICSECVESCKEIFEETKAKPKRLSLASIPAPKKIKKSLDEYVIGQDQTKKVLSTAAYNHYKRIVFSSMSKKTALSGVGETFTNGILRLIEPQEDALSPRDEELSSKPKSFPTQQLCPAP